MLGCTKCKPIDDFGSIRCGECEGTFTLTNDGKCKPPADFDPSTGLTCGAGEFKETDATGAILCTLCTIPGCTECTRSATGRLTCKTCESVFTKQDGKCILPEGSSATIKNDCPAK